MNRPAARLEARQNRPSDTGRKQCRGDDQDARGGKCQQEVLEQLKQQFGIFQQGKTLRIVQPVDQHEAGKHRQKKQRRYQHRADNEVATLEQHACAGNDGPGAVGRLVEGARVHGRRALPDSPCRECLAVAECRLAFEVPIGPDLRVAFQHGIRPHAGFASQGDRPEAQFPVLHASVLEVGRVADADAISQREQVRHPQRHGSDDHVTPDLRPQGTEPPDVHG